MNPPIVEVPVYSTHLDWASKTESAERMALAETKLLHAVAAALGKFDHGKDADIILHWRVT